MNMLCNGVDITLMDTYVSVTCNNKYPTAAFFSVGSDWYSLRLQTRNYWHGQLHLPAFNLGAGYTKHQSSPFA